MRLEVSFSAGDPGGAALVVPVRGGAIPSAYAAQAAADCPGEPADFVCDILGGERRVLLVHVTGDWRQAGARAASHTLRERHLVLDLHGVLAADGAAFIEGAWPAGVAG